MLESSRSALSQDMIEQQMNGKADRVTIYRVLNSFCQDGIAHRVVSDDGRSYFALCSGCCDGHHNHEHFHFRCLSCNKVECLNEPVDAKLPQGYRSENVNFWISGYCKDCR